MAKEIGNNKISRLTHLEQQLSELTTALTEQKDYLERHTTSMLKLTQAIKQLELTIRKGGALDSQTTLSLIDLIRVFVEYEINPRFYEDLHRTMLKASNESPPTDTGHRKLGSPAEKKDR
jgi:uncharacterized coiled-coil protein SlyX